MSKRLSRRSFNALLGTLSLALPAVVVAQGSKTAALAAGAEAEERSSVRTVRFADGKTVPAVGQGSWHLAQGRHPAAVEEEALRTGISLGMTLIDTSGNYGTGRSEELIGRVISGQRNKIFLVTKVEADEVSGNSVAQACDASLARLGTDYIDLYLLHWPVLSIQFAGVVAAFEQLGAKGKIRAWGVSNFNARRMDELFRVPNGDRCATNQVPYSLNNRRIERDVLPWCEMHGMPVMAYSPLGGDNKLVVGDPTVGRIGEAHGCSTAAVALAWVTRNGNVIAIPESGSPAHVKENAVALSLTLTQQELQMLDAAYRV
jgi:diketogulonate reductase-like aldo/keto reductase